jgi:hypothetical protein
MTGRVSQSFVRNIRKGYLRSDGTPEPGFKELANVLLEVSKELQAGNYDFALDIADAYGLELEKLYREYISIVRKRVNTTKFINLLQQWCNENGINFVQDIGKHKPVLVMAQQ